MTDRTSTEAHTDGVVTTGTRAQLVIADDDRLIQATLAAQLGEEFELVGVAADAEEAVDLARHVRPDVALLDVQMPGGGLHATRRIREVSPETAIVILSVDETDQSVREFLTAGAETYLRKGAPGSVIVQRLHESIAAHAATGT